MIQRKKTVEVKISSHMYSMYIGYWKKKSTPLTLVNLNLKQNTLAFILYRVVSNKVFGVLDIRRFRKN